MGSPSCFRYPTVKWIQTLYDMVHMHAAIMPSLTLRLEVPRLFHIRVVCATLMTCHSTVCIMVGVEQSLPSIDLETASPDALGEFRENGFVRLTRRPRGPEEFI